MVAAHRDRPRIAEPRWHGRRRGLHRPVAELPGAVVAEAGDAARRRDLQGDRPWAVGAPLDDGARADQLAEDGLVDSEAGEYVVGARLAAGNAQQRQQTGRRAPERSRRLRECHGSTLPERSVTVNPGTLRLVRFE